MTRVLRTALAIVLVGAAAACGGGGGDPIEEALGTLDLRERVSQLIIPAAPGSSVASSNLESRYPTLVAAAVPADSLVLAPPGDVRAVARRLARTLLDEGANLAILHLPGSEQPFPDESRHEPIREAIRGMNDAGVATAVSLFAEALPGEPPLTTDLAFLQAHQLGVAGAAAASGVHALVPGSARVPALTGDTLLLPLSPTAITQLHRDFGWDGVVIAEVQPGSALAREYGEAGAAWRAIAAGSDLVLGATDPAALADSLIAAVLDGRLSQLRINEAVRRVLRLRGETAAVPIADPTAGPPSATRSPSPHAARQETFESPQFPTLVQPEEAGMDAAALASVDAVIESALADSLFTAAALAVARKGQVVHLRGYGDEPSGNPVDPKSTIFDLASLTKVMGTTSAVAALVEDGRMELDDPVRLYLPRFRGEHKNDVTIRHLLAHTSGIPPGLWLYGSARSPEQALEQVLRQALRRPPGERAEYSDLGMILLAAAAEEAAGEPLDQYLARRIFGPLGLTSTMYLPPLAFRDRVIPTAIRSERGFELHGVVHDGNAFRLGGVAGHAGLFSTARDVLAFGQAMLDGGELRGHRVLEPTTVATFTRRQPQAGTRALGWDTPADRSSAGRYLSSRSFGHTGYTGTSLWIDPELNLVVVLLTNRTFDGGSGTAVLRLRQAVHEGVARAIRDVPVPRRAGAR